MEDGVCVGGGEDGGGQHVRTIYICGAYVTDISGGGGVVGDTEECRGGCVAKLQENGDLSFGYSRGE